MSGDRTLIDLLLAEQSELTAVETFALAQARQEVAPARYRELLPMRTPSTGEQYAFDVDLDRCSGCKACVTACHAMNGLDENESWRDTGLLVSSDWRRPFQQTITTACHHCLDPACLNGCPVLAYEKDPRTGIVRHFDDQCIGCQYCVLKCPYEVPKYSERRGIVRKCDMCSQRLLASEAPACAQACPSEAIRIVVVERQEIAAGLGRAGIAGATGAGAASFLPASPDPTITIPSTSYRSRHALPPDLIPGSAAVPGLQPANHSLVWMLVLTQLSVGGYLWNLFLPQPGRLRLALLGIAAGLSGLAASVFHLGKPLKAWRSFLGWRRSWLSREIIGLGVFMMFAGGAAAGSAWRTDDGWSIFFESGAAMTGLAAVFCSAMVYEDTRRPFWMGPRVFGKFFGTVAVLGLAGAAMVSELAGAGWIQPLLILALALKLAGEHKMLRRADQEISSEPFPGPSDTMAWSLARSARLMKCELGLVMRLRFLFGVAAIVLEMALWVFGGSRELAAAIFSICFAGEILERYLFFKAVTPLKLPGAP